MKKINKKLKGYTLIELLLALGVIAILAIVIFFTFAKANTNNQIKTESDNIAKYYNIYSQYSNSDTLSRGYLADDAARYENARKGFLNIFKMEGVLPEDAIIDESGDFIESTNKFSGMTIIEPFGFGMENIPVEACDRLINSWYSIAETPNESRIGSCASIVKANAKLIIYFNYDSKTISIRDNEGGYFDGGSPPFGV